MKIGIIAAMTEEAKTIIDRMTDPKQTDIAGSRFYEGTVSDVPLVLVQSGIGKVNAAIATSLLIHHFQAEFVINTGSAGGTGDQLAIGDLVISTELNYHDADARAFGYTYGQIPQMPASYQVEEPHYQMALRVGQRLGWQVHAGLIVTGDSFIASHDDIASVKTHFPQALVTEMEGAAVAQTCHQFGVGYLVIRAVSDVADEVASVNFDEFIIQAGKDSAELVLALVEEMQAG